MHPWFRQELMEMLKLQISLGAVSAEEGKIAQQAGFPHGAQELDGEWKIRARNGWEPGLRRLQSSIIIM